MSKTRVEVGVLGATGMAGTEYVRLLSNHPWFKLKFAVGKRSTGIPLGKAKEWPTSFQLPDDVAGITVSAPAPEKQDADIFFSCLPTEAARELEPIYARFHPTFSDASAYRLDPDVPLMIPEVNPEQVALLEAQKTRAWRGFLVTSPNCTSVGLDLTLKPLDQAFGLKKVVVSTMQAVSGAGYPGVPSIDIIDNVIPYIESEEEKVAAESRKILGKVRGGHLEPADLDVAAMCHRVAVTDGHLESVYLETKERITPDTASDALRGFQGIPQKLKLPTAPEHPILVLDDEDRPQPRLDRYAGSVPGMSVTVGRVRRGIDDHSLKYSLLVHNTIRGAAGNAILLAELFYRMDWLERH